MRHPLVDASLTPSVMSVISIIIILKLFIINSVENSGSRSRPSAWIARFLDRPENEFLCPVDDSFVRDRFNLIGLDELVPGFELALCTVLDDTGAIGARGKRAAELLYGLVHARYIMTPQGVAKMLAKHEAGCFGHCPRVYCDHSLALPIGN